MEGGLFQWKIQKLNISRGPVADYSDISRPLPDPPKGMVWRRDEETRGFSLSKEKESSSLPTEEKYPCKWEMIDKANLICEEGQGKWTVSNGAGDLESNAGYFEHVVLPSDTLEGICLQYKISATKLRQVNHFSGSSLILAPKRLQIPLDNITRDNCTRNGATRTLRMQDRNSEEYKVHKFFLECPDLGISEIKAYLDLYNSDIKKAIAAARDDEEWEKTQDGSLDICKSPPTLPTSFISVSKGNINCKLRFEHHNENSAEKKKRREYGAKALNNLLADKQAADKWQEISPPETLYNISSAAKETTHYRIENVCEGIPILFFPVVPTHEVRNTMNFEDAQKAPPIEFGLEMQVISSNSSSKRSLCPG